MYNILVADDEPNNLLLIEEFLEDGGFNVKTANNGLEALELLTEDPNKFDLILLDRMMPKMNGIELIKKLKNNNQLASIPIIMQTAAADPKQVQEGMQAGIYHYLTKPYDDETLINIVNACIRDNQKKLDLKEIVSTIHPLKTLIKSCYLEFKTITEAKDVATYVAALYPEPGKVVMGISELLINAVEHGNLEIKYARKTELNKQKIWEAEVNRLLLLPQHKDKIVKVTYQCDINKTIELHIIDEGDGFDWKEYMELNTERAIDSHGRGIAIAAALSFDSIEYLGKGNEVKCTLSI